MRYFLLGLNPAYKPIAPDLLDWYDIINPKLICKGKSRQLPQRELIWIRSNKDTVFTDIISFPFLLVSQRLRDIIKKYEPHTVFKEIVLLDGDNELVGLYFLPILDEVQCLAETSELSLDKSVIKRGVLKSRLAAGHDIFRIAGLKNTHYAVSLDLAESMIRRGVRGLGLTLLEEES